MNLDIQLPNKFIPTPELEEAFSVTKVDMMKRPDSTFLTTIFFNLDHVWDTSIEKINISGTSIRYNPEFFMQMPSEFRVTTLMQATMHIALMHPDRMQGRDPKRWNKACDYTVNEMLKASNYALEDSMAHDANYYEKSAEEIYSLLPEDPPGTDSNNGWDDQTEPTDPNEASNIRDKVQNMVLQASQQAKMAGDKPGSIPGEFQLFLDKLLNPKLPYTTILRRYMQAQAKNDYSFRRPNGRYLPHYYLPSMISEGLVDLMVGVDISGSVSDSDFAQFVSDTHSVMKQFKPKKIDFVQFDTKIQHHDVIRTVGDLQKLKFTGRGGTDPRELIELAQKLKPKVLMIYTDGEFYAEDLPKYKGPTIWLIHNNPSFVAPFGTMIHYELSPNY